MEFIRTIDELRDRVASAKGAGMRVGLVPTMGALHAGHLSLVSEARSECGFVVVSVFVNPTQFGPSEDFDRYPRPLTADCDLCEKAGVDVVFAPEVKEMYPDEQVTWVNVEKITEPLCGASRPGHFRGVATVCAKLFNIVLPDRAYFGQKDAQQVAVIKRMVQDLNMPLEIRVCPTVRESNGLAMSSRNKYLSESEKENAVFIKKSLEKCRQLVRQGVLDRETIESEMRQILESGGVVEIEYIGVVDADTMERVDRIGGKVLVAVAVKVGSTRLIDNILVDAEAN